MLRNEIPYLLLSEKVENFDFLENRSNKGKMICNLEKSTLLFIFSRPCSSCEKNISFWNAIAEICKTKLIFGIVVDDQEKSNSFKINANLDFRIIFPKNIDDFKRKFHLKTNHAHTILIEKNKVVFIKMGVLDERNFYEILKKCEKK